MRTKRHVSRKPSKVSRFFYYFSAFIFFGVLVYILFFSPYLSVNSVRVHGTKDLDPNVILENVNSHISGKYLGLVANNNFILIRKDKIRSSLEERFKKIESVGIKKIFPSGLEVEITERGFVLLFRSDDSLWLVDEKGMVFDSADFSSDNINTGELITINDESAKAVAQEKDLLNADYINFVTGMRKELNQMMGMEIDNDVTISSLVSPDIRVRTKEGWEIYFSREIELKKEVDMLKVVLENMIDPQKRQGLEYVDLRIDNKVFYKFKDGAQQEMDKQEEEKQPEIKPEEPKKEKKKKNK